MIAALLIFAATYFVIAVGKLPFYRIDRAGAALLGAALMVGLGVLTPEEAYAAVDLETITLLLGMMILVANLRLSGFFRLASAFVLRRARHPLALLAAVALVAGVLSAFLVNDTICLVMTPLVLDVVLRLKRDPRPYLLALAMASNAGSTATITGNPQNMIIGTLSGWSYGGFALALSPVALFAMAMTVALVAAFHPRDFLVRAGFGPPEAGPVRYHRALVTKSAAVALAMVVLFFLGAPVATVAIIGGAFLLLTRRVKAEKVYLDVDWPLLVMFVSLFIVVAGAEKALLTEEVRQAVGRLDLASVPLLAAVTAIFSNIVSNVPAVLVLRPFLEGLADPRHAWLVVAMAATLAGNFTLVGSVANLIVAQRARRDGVELGFGYYFRVGAPLTVVSILFGVWWLG